MVTESFLHHCLIYEFELGTKIPIVVKNICRTFGDDTVDIKNCILLFENFMYGNNIIDEDNQRNVIFIQILELNGRKYKNKQSINNLHFRQNINLEKSTKSI